MAATIVKELKIEGLDTGNWKKEFKTTYWHKSIMEGTLVATRIGRTVGSMTQFVNKFDY